MIDVIPCIATENFTAVKPACLNMAHLDVMAECNGYFSYKSCINLNQSEYKSSQWYIVIFLKAFYFLITSAFFTSRGEAE